MNLFCLKIKYKSNFLYYFLKKVPKKHIIDFLPYSNHANHVCFNFKYVLDLNHLVKLLLKVV